MWPRSPFAHPVSSFEHPVPLVGVDPDAEPAVFISFNAKWLPYVVGALKQLVLQSTWRTDDADLCKLEQARAMTLLSIFSRAMSTAPNGPRFTGDVDVANPCEFLRMHNGKLQALCCFDPVTGMSTWEDIPGQGDGTSNPAAIQPQDGERPAPGQSKCYPVQLSAKDTWQLPFAIAVGDVVTVSDVTGLWSDGTLNLFRPDGTPSPFGAPIGVPGHDGSDPDLSAYHMELIALGPGTYYPAYNTAFTIGAGAGPNKLIFQANDGSLGDNGGNISFKVCVESGATPPPIEWCYIIDFTLSDYGWVTIPAAPGAVYHPGEGWGSQLVSGFNNLNVQSPTFPAAHITSVETFYFTNTDHGGGTDRFISTNVWTNIYGALDNGAGTFDTTITADAPSVTQLFAVISSTDPSSPGLYRLSKMIVRGLGDNPFGPSNC